MTERRTAAVRPPGSRSGGETTGSSRTATAGTPSQGASARVAPPPDGTGVLVAVPTYDERDNLADLVARLRRVVPGARILVVDDASPDGTGELAERLGATDPLLAVHHRGGRAGLGAAYVDAFTRVLDRHDATEVGWIVQMDADGSHAPEDLTRILAAGADADVVLGSRYVPGGAVRAWPARRRWLSRAGNAYARHALRMPLHDVTGGYRLFHRRVLEAVAVTTVASQGYCFQVDVAFRVLRSGFTVREVPITFVERARGSSKMNGAVVREALWRVTSWAVRDRRRRRR